MAEPKKGAADKTLAGRAYQALRQDILSGRLPAGSKLKLEGLVADYQVGMSPLREALTRLAGDHLVVAEGQRGFWVAPLSPAELDDISHVRALLETEALNLAVRKGGAQWEAAVGEAYERLSEVELTLQEMVDPPAELVAEWEQRSEAFHAALVSGCGSPWLMRLSELLYQQAERYRRVSLKESRGRRFVHDEHAAIYEAAMQRNALRLCRLTEDHLSRTLDEVRRAVSEQAGREAAA